MKKNLPSIGQNSSLVLKQAKNLLGVTQKILNRGNNFPEDTSWVQRLLDWSDKNLLSEKDLPRHYHDLINLRELGLPNQHLTTLPPEIGNLVNLEILQLGPAEFDDSGNLLTKLPSEIGNLINIMYLDLSYNNLSELPDSIGDLVHLEQLYLCDNNLSELPESITKMKKLTHLSLGENPKLALTDKQKQWLEELHIKNNCDIEIDDDCINRVHPNETHFRQ